MKKWLTLFVCMIMIVAVTACGQETVKPDDSATISTTEPTEEIIRPTGGDANECTEHSARYHRISGKLIKKYPVESYWEECKEVGLRTNIVGYVEYHNIPREEFVELMEWDVAKLDELMDDKEGNQYCPYTYNQFLDAIYGDDAELTAWVFAPEDTWPEIEEPAE